MAVGIYVLAEIVSNVLLKKMKMEGVRVFGGQSKELICHIKLGWGGRVSASFVLGVALEVLESRGILKNSDCNYYAILTNMDGHRISKHEILKSDTCVRIFSYKKSESKQQEEGKNKLSFDSKGAHQMEKFVQSLAANRDGLVAFVNTSESFPGEDIMQYGIVCCPHGDPSTFFLANYFASNKSLQGKDANEYQLQYMDGWKKNATHIVPQRRYVLIKKKNDEET